MSFMFFNAELDRPSALSDVHFAAFIGDIVNAWCSQSWCIFIYPKESELRLQHGKNLNVKSKNTGIIKDKIWMKQLYYCIISI
jgi:hypothetical protein